MCGRGVICDSANLYSSYLQLHTPILGELGLDLGPAILREVRRVDEVQQQQHVGIAQVVDGSVTAVACIIEGGEGGGELSLLLQLHYVNNSSGIRNNVYVSIASLPQG